MNRMRSVEGMKVAILKRLCGFTLLLSAMASSAPAFALPTAKDILDDLASSSDEDVSNIIKVHINGIVDGLQWANTAVNNRGDQRLWCQPEKLSLSVEQTIVMLKQYVAENPRNADAPIGLALLYAMRYTFPCTDEKRIEKPAP